jgi:LPS-assembly protein
LLLSSVLAAILAGQPGPATAAEQNVIGCPIIPPPRLSSLPGTDQRDVIDVSSGDLQYDLNGLASFENGLLLRRGEQQLGADRASYDRGSGRFTVSGHIDYRDLSTWIRGDSATYDSAADALSVTGADFDLHTLPGRGAADSLDVQQGRELTLTNASYTSCTRGKDDWLLKAGKLTIDRETGTATARNATLEFMGVPILYSPYLTYPVTDQRKSGLLLPDFGQSAQRGFDVTVPYYLNLAPNYDATLLPRFMSRRGLQAAADFRYLTAGSSGTIMGEYLPDDDVTSTGRGLWAWKNRTQLPFGWRASMDATNVSDSTYFEDFGSGLGETSLTHLPRRLELEYFNEIWELLLRFEEYETLDESLLATEEPYQRLPQFAASAHFPDAFAGLDFEFDSELTYFHRDVGLTGLRAHLKPDLRLPVRFGGFYLEPSVALDHTRYDLDNPAPGAESTPDLTVPTYSADFGAVLERAWGRNSRWLQTLEPRMLFVYTPFEQQSDLPVFDTIEPDFNLVQLFSRNRFVGLDRVGDTERLNLGVTTRLINSLNGTQFLTATLGETRYFSSRDVVLPGQVPVDSNSSDYIAELGMNLRETWKLDLGWQWDSDASETRLAETRVLYQPDNDRVANLSYRYRRDSLEEVDFAVAWPLGNRWSAIGRYNYSLRDNEPLDRFVGFEYATCCWGVRTTWRRQLVSRTGESDTAFAVQLLLKGFGSRGSGAERMLERGILGYDRFDKY